MGVRKSVSVVGPGKFFKAFKILRYIIKAAKTAKNFRKTLTVAEATAKHVPLGKSLMTTANNFVADVVKTAREKVIEAIEDSTSNAVGELLQVDEGSLALLEVAYGASNVKTRDDMASFVSDSSGTLFDAMLSGSRRKMNDPWKQSEESYAPRQSNSDDESIVSVQFGVVHEQAHQTLLNKLKQDGLLRASSGFDINEFGLFDESSATILECINSYADDTVSSIVHCSGSCSYCESTTASSFAGTFAVASNYASNQNCRWLISAPRTIARIQLSSHTAGSRLRYNQQVLVSVLFFRNLLFPPKSRRIKWTG